MSNMAIDHDQVVVSDHRIVALAQTTMHGDVFSNGITVADMEFAALLRRLLVLRFPAQDRTFADFVVRTQASAIFDRNASRDGAVITDPYVAVDDTERANADSATNFRLRG